MSLNNIALFLHVVGVLLLVSAFTVEGISLLHLRHAQTGDQVAEWQRVAALTRVFGPASVVAILVPGLYMMIASWGWVPWIAVGLLTWLLIAVLGAVNGIRLSLITRRAAGGDPSALHQLRARVFVVSWCTRIGLAVDIVFLMITKPDTLGSLIVTGVASGLGLAGGTITGVPRSRQRAERVS